MSFEKKEWKYRDTITADELNRLERGVEDALDKGYVVEKNCETLLDATSVTTESDGSYIFGTLNFEDPEFDYITVVFNGTTYNNVPRGFDGEYQKYIYGKSNGYGGFAFDEYPFGIKFASNGTQLYTSEAGTYEISIQNCESNVQVSDDFKTAVLAVLSDQ